MKSKTIAITLASALSLTSFAAFGADFSPYSLAGKRSQFNDRAIIIVGGKSGGFGDTVSLNPQPLPPKALYRSFNRGAAVSLNPQPLPPKAKFGSTWRGSEVSLNPQPLPPRSFRLR